LPYLQKVGASGIGLFRTEGIFLHQQHLPSEDEQAAIYTRIAERIYPQRVIIRTLDLGGDKIAPTLMNVSEENPFLGWRAIRFWLDHKTGFLRQLKAILRANVKGNVQLLIPMVSGLGEILQVKQLLEEAKGLLSEEGVAYNQKIELGIMIEVPSAAVTADFLAKEVDFFSIGTNDLVQYTLAVDRGNDKVAHLYSHFHPSVLRMLMMVLDAGKKADISVSMCGEMASDPRAIPLLLAMGFTELSASPHSIPEMKRIIRELSLPECQSLLAEIHQLTLTREISATVNRFFGDRFPDLNLGD
jgi:phosphotransferase system enzyme I (PtsI)